MANADADADADANANVPRGVHLRGTDASFRADTSTGTGWDTRAGDEPGRGYRPPSEAVK